MDLKRQEESTSLGLEETGGLEVMEDHRLFHIVVQRSTINLAS